MSRRLVLAWLALTLAVLALLVVPLGYTNARRQVEDVQQAVLRDAYAIATFADDVLRESGDQAALVAVADRYADETGARVVIVDATGVGVADTDPPEPGRRSFASRPEFAEALAGQVSTGTRSSVLLGADFVYVAVPVASAGKVFGAVRITYPAEDVDGRIRRGWLALAGVALVSITAAVALALGLARWVVGPLRGLEQTAQRLGKGELSARADERSGPPEVRALAASFNRTATRLEQLVGSQEAFVADASHQLRSPLTALRLRLENLEAEATEEPEREAGADGERSPRVATLAADARAALTEAARLSRLVDGLLVLARADREPMGGQPHVVGPLLEERRNVWAPLAEERQVRLDVEAGPPVTAVLEPDRLAQIVDNLIANALDATPVGGRILLAARSEPDGVAVHVIDTGAGLGPDERERAFDRFWRAQPGRRNGDGHEDLGGTGLGLSIVSKLAAVDGATARLDEAEAGGIDAVITYPG